MIDIDDPTKWKKRDFFVVGTELARFGDMINGIQYTTLDDARADVKTEKCVGIYRVTIDCEGYWINGDWVLAR